MEYAKNVGSRLRRFWPCAFVMMFSGVAVAQAPGRPVDRESGWLTWVIAGGIIIVVCLTGFLNAKRSHLH